MSRYVFKMPDLGEGTVSAEVVEWKVKVGDAVKEDQIIAEVMTDKAAVEIPAPVSGRVVSITGQPGDMVAVGSELIAFDTSGASPVETPAAPARNAAPAAQAEAPARAAPAASATSAQPAMTASRVMASPATRRKAHVAGVDLSTVNGTGPGGRISAQDLESVIAGKSGAVARPAARKARSGTEEIKVIGVRRVIAERMSAAKRNIPHFAYVEEVDVTELESLRQYLNGRQPKGAQSLTYLPFLVAALTRVLENFPQCNAVYDAERNLIVRHAAVHVGVATQTPDGLKVPVVRNAEARSLADLASEIRRVSEAARSETYGPTLRLIQGLARAERGYAHDAADRGRRRHRAGVGRPADQARAISNRRPIPVTRIADIARITRASHAHGALTVMDDDLRRLPQPRPVWSGHLRAQPAPSTLSGHGDVISAARSSRARS